MKKNGFTLIELLVVMAIIALMLTVMIPSLAKAKQQSRDVYCRNNLRQMVLAAIAYAENQSGFFPYGYYSVKTPAEKTQYCWDFTVRRNSEGVFVESGILWQGDTIEKIQQCPSFKGDSNTAADPYTGYNYNVSFIGRGQQEGIPMSAKFQDVRFPAGCALFGDGQTTHGANKFMRSPLPSDSDWNFFGRWAGTQGFRHNLSTNIAWCDGAVGSQKELFSGSDADGTKPVVEQYNLQNPHCPIGFLSEGNGAYKLR